MFSRVFPFFVCLGLWVCAINPSVAVSQGYPSSNCHFENVAPVNKLGWEHGTTVPYYIDPSITGDRRTAISTAFTNWSNSASQNGSGVTFTEVSQPPAPGTGYSVLNETPTITGLRASTQTFQDTNGVTVGATTRLSPAMTNSAAVLEAMSHEIGHPNGFGDCNSCEIWESVMANGDYGSNFNTVLGRPTSPTPCDNELLYLSNYDGCPPTLPAPGAGWEWDIYSCSWLSTGEPTPAETGQFDCNDGIDNDGNGLADCDDASCSHYCIGGCSQAQWAACWDVGAPQCVSGQCYTPIVIDTLGNGIKLSNAQDGVRFNVINNRSMRLAWTTPNSDDAWLTLDRNGNGSVDGGEELFGNATPQPVPPPGVEKNGYLALAEYDKSQNGGNGDGVISPSDAIFASLRLWQDTNHNGLSEPAELHTLSEFGLETLELDYRESKRVDEYGNKFRYRAKVKDGHGNQVGRWAWDVFLKMLP